MNSVIIRTGKTKKTVTINNSSSIAIEKKEYAYELIHLQNSTYLLKIKDQFFKVNYLDTKGENYILSINGEEYITSSKSLLKEKAEELVGNKDLENSSKLLKAPMPGMVLDVKVNIGDRIKKGNTLLILEAMKMENSLKSPFSGVIKEIYVERNNPVEKDAKLLSIE